MPRGGPLCLGEVPTPLKLMQAFLCSSFRGESTAFSRFSKGTVIQTRLKLPPNTRQAVAGAGGAYQSGREDLLSLPETAEFPGNALPTINLFL